jgi:hypothetical protein
MTDVVILKSASYGEVDRSEAEEDEKTHIK